MNLKEHGGLPGKITAKQISTRQYKVEQANQKWRSMRVIRMIKLFAHLKKWQSYNPKSVPLLLIHTVRKRPLSNENRNGSTKQKEKKSRFQLLKPTSNSVLRPHKAQSP